LSFAAVAKGALELSKRTKETYPYRWIWVLLYSFYNAMFFAKDSQGFFYKVSYKIFHQPFLLDFIKLSVLSLILGGFKNLKLYIDIRDNYGLNLHLFGLSTRRAF